jgi:D-glycero-D-manno-heptose 1,7-bisphosphate phosphatase
MRSEMTKAFGDVTFVFLDRDGVLNRKPPAGKYVTCWAEFELLPGVEEALARIHRSGRKSIVVTNQRGVALGLYSMEQLGDMHERLQQNLAACGARLDAIYVCPHDDGQCDCRKPMTGLFEQAFRDFPEACAANSVMVGDSLRDVEAGRRAGMRTVLIDDGVGAPTPHELRLARSLASVTVPSLVDFVDRHLFAQHLL